MKKAWAFGLIAVLHVVVIGSLLIQGCGTTRPAAQTEPAVMPPVMEPAVAPAVVEPEKVELPPVEVPTKVYTVKAGDSLSYIAQRFNVSTRDIIKMNKISNPNKIVIGTKLTLPGYVDLNAKEPVRKTRKTVAKPTKKSAPVAAGGGEYVVKSGDTLGHIAARSGTTSKAIKQLNNLTSDSLRVGQKLALPKGGEVVAPAAEGAPADEASVAVAEAAVPVADAAVVESKPGELLHVVEPNQQLDAIAMIYGVRVEELIKLNNLASPDVKVGQTLKIPPPVE